MNIPIESLNVFILNVGYAEHNADWNWQDVCSPFARIYYVTEGTGRIRIDDTVHELTPNHLYVIPPNTTHSTECEGKFSHFYVHVYEGFNDGTSLFEHFQFPFAVDDHANDKMLFNELMAMFPSSSLPASNPDLYNRKTILKAYTERFTSLPLYLRLRLRSGVLYILSRFMELAKPMEQTKDSRLVTVLNYIHDNLEREISIEELSDAACMSKSYLIRTFSKQMGVPPLHYINDKKMARAKMLLLSSQMSVKEIAYKLGYCDNSYFVKLFRRKTGYTPQKFRTEHL